ncbi:cupin-like domain-containing protein [Aureococcus anophagefferens]|nr:cupin-like domain-containing protein [Aureococcus anophagefferens]
MATAPPLKEKFTNLGERLKSLRSRGADGPENGAWTNDKLVFDRKAFLALLDEHATAPSPGVEVRAIGAADVRAGLAAPVVARANYGESLGFEMPPRDLQPRDVADMTCGGTFVPVLDVRSQSSSQRVTLNEWADYWERAPRSRTLNVISLEVSGSPLGSLVHAPAFVRDVDWVSTSWLKGAQRPAFVHVGCGCDGTRKCASTRSAPHARAGGPPGRRRHGGGRGAPRAGAAGLRRGLRRRAAAARGEARRARRGRGIARARARARVPPAAPEAEPAFKDRRAVAASPPRVQKYVLMSVGGSYTDFHVDFGGTSVWYHVLRGAKVMYLAAPTPANLSAFKRWNSSAAQAAVPFAAYAPGAVGTVRLTSGDTLVIPSGWIHAVYTPEDSMVFGGNFLCTSHVESQLKVVRLEDALKVPQPMRFPALDALAWFAVCRGCDALNAGLVAGEAPDLTVSERRGLGLLGKWLRKRLAIELPPPSIASGPQLLDTLDFLLSAKARALYDGDRATGIRVFEDSGLRTPVTVRLRLEQPPNEPRLEPLDAVLGAPSKERGPCRFYVADDAPPPPPPTPKPRPPVAAAEGPSPPKRAYLRLPRGVAAGDVVDVDLPDSLQPGGAAALLKGAARKSLAVVVPPEALPHRLLRVPLS